MTLKTAVSGFLAQARAHFAADSSLVDQPPQDAALTPAKVDNKVRPRRHASTNLQELRNATPDVYAAEWGDRKVLVRIPEPRDGMRPVILPLAYFKGGEKLYDRRTDGGFFIPHHFVRGKRPKLPEMEKLPPTAQEFMDSVLLVLRSAAAYQWRRQQPDFHSRARGE
ncbi:MAG TPA: hypothetical protein VJJ02_03665 [Candidatus Paceibacterota bacterium]